MMVSERKCLARNKKRSNAESDKAGREPGFVLLLIGCGCIVRSPLMAVIFLFIRPLGQLLYFAVNTFDLI